MAQKKVTSLEAFEKLGRKIERAAKRSKADESFYFLTTFDRYMTQIRILASLQAVINAEDVLITKEYVKGRENVYTNPAIKEYNSTASAANKTVETLIKILSRFGSEEEKEADPLAAILGGGMDE